MGAALSMPAPPLSWGESAKMPDTDAALAGLRERATARTKPRPESQGIFI